MRAACECIVHYRGWKEEEHLGLESLMSAENKHRVPAEAQSLFVPTAVNSNILGLMHMCLFHSQEENI